MILFLYPEKGSCTFVPILDKSPINGIAITWISDNVLTLKIKTNLHAMKDVYDYVSRLIKYNNINKFGRKGDFPESLTVNKH